MIRVEIITVRTGKWKNRRRLAPKPRVRFQTFPAYNTNTYAFRVRLCIRPRSFAVREWLRFGRSLACIHAYTVTRYI